MTPDIVFVRGADRQLHRFALLELSDKAAFVCREDVFNEIVEGKRQAPGIGFPLDDVFRATENLPIGAVPQQDQLRSLERAEA